MPVTKNVMMKTLEWGYDKAINPPMGLSSANDLAEQYLKEDGTLEEKVDSFIRWQLTKAALSGAASGIGGIITAPVAIPANIASVLYIQIRMIATIAIMAGFDPHDDKVKTIVFCCLLGKGAGDVLKEMGVKLGAKLTYKMIQKIPYQVTKSINRQVGTRLIIKYKNTGFANFFGIILSLIPIFVPVVDDFSIRTIGKVAKKQFC